MQFREANDTLFCYQQAKLKPQICINLKQKVNSIKL